MLLLAVFLAASAVSEGPYEEPPILLTAAEAAPAKQLKGEHHEVRNGVENDGLMNNYIIETEFGLFEAEGNFQLGKRVMEIEAIAQLKEVTRTEAFTKALQASATRQVRGAQQAIEQPVETAKGIPGGVSRLVKRTKRKAEDLSETAKEEYAEYKEEKAEKKAREEEEQAAREAAEARGETLAEPEKEPSVTSEEAKEAAKKGAEYGEEYAKKWAGYTQNRRRWAAELGVDPYSDNQVLNEELYRVAQAAAAGSLTMKFVPVPKIGVLGDLRDISQLVWTQDPLDLRMRNEALLYEMGVTEAQVEAMYENKYQTPTSTTFLTDALSRLDGVEGRELFIEVAAKTDSVAQTEFVARAATFFAGYHENTARIERLGNWAFPVPQAVTENSRLVLALPVDRLHWTQAVAQVFETRLAEARETTGTGVVEAWLSGGCSERALEGLRAAGVDVHTDSFEQAGSSD
jgi:hypothetical protein